MPDKTFKILKKHLPKIRQNILLEHHTTFKIGGPAEYFLIAKTKEDLIRAVKVCLLYTSPSPRD